MPHSLQVTADSRVEMPGPSLPVPAAGHVGG